MNCLTLYFKNLNVTTSRRLFVLSNIKDANLILQSKPKLFKIMPFYAVAKGKQPGIFLTWSECQEQITGFKGAVYKKFATEEEASEFIQERGSNIIDRRVKICKKDSNVPSQHTTNQESNKNGKISPTLVEMKKEMKLLQKEVSSLRDKFDNYVSSKTSPTEIDLKRKISDISISTKKSKSSESSSSDIKDNKKFNVNEDGFLVVFTDGACEFNGRNGARAGIGVYFGSGHPMNVSEPVNGRATNNTAEIQAATLALKLTKSAGFDKVIINTDSQFTINCITSWLQNWKKNDWRKRDGTEVINKEDLIELDRASEGLLIKWNHVKAHDGNPGNEAADKLARNGAKSYVPSSPN